MAVKVGQRKDKPGWWVFVHHQGRRIKKCFGPGKSGERVARQFAEKLSARIKWAETNGEAVVLAQSAQPVRTVKQHLMDWLEMYAKPHCKPSTYRGYKRSIEQQLVPCFGDMPLEALKRDHIKRFIAQQIEEGSAGSDKQPGKQKARWTIQGYLVPLKAAYNQAMEDGLVTFNPVARLGRLLRGHQDRRAHIQPLTREEVQQLLTTCEQHYSYLYPVLLCAVRAGLRMGEVIGLKWTDVDFHGRFIEVRHSVVLGEETTTKSHKIRRVEMSSQLQSVLRRLREIRELEAMATNEAVLPWVFLSPERQRLDERNLRRGWYRCLERAGIRKVRFHDLRHSFISLLIEQGAHPKYIQEQAGHSSIQVTMDTYGHLFPSRERGWTDKLDDEAWRGETAPSTHPEKKAAEQLSPKSLV
jgi:integrase